MQRYHCDYEPLAGAFVTYFSLPFGTLLSDPLAFLEQVVLSVTSGLMHDFNLYRYIVTEAEWLPKSYMPLPAEFFAAEALYARALVIARYALLILCIQAALRVLLQRALPMSTNTADALLLRHARWLLLALMLTLAGLLCVSGIQRMWYQSGMQTALLYIAVVLSVVVLGHQAGGHRFVSYGLRILAIIAVLAGGVTLMKYYPLLTEPALRERLSPKGSRVLMLSMRDIEQKIAQAKQAYARCELPPEANAKHLILDDYTYAAFRHTQQPYHFYYISVLELDSVHSREATTQDYRQLMRSYHSDGLLIDCRHMRDALRQEMQETQGFCCLKPGE
jgi:hypothetical protein